MINEMVTIEVKATEYQRLIKQSVKQINAIQRVRDLHNQIGDYCGYCADIGSCCNPKDFEYPCPTIKALEGEQ